MTSRYDGRAQSSTMGQSCTVSTAYRVYRAALICGIHKVSLQFRNCYKMTNRLLKLCFNKSCYTLCIFLRGCRFLGVDLIVLFINRILEIHKFSVIKMLITAEYIANLIKISHQLPLYYIFKTVNILHELPVYCLVGLHPGKSWLE